MTTMAVTYDYTREAAVLARMLRPGSLPMGMAFNWEQPEDDELAYLGEVEVACSGDARISRLTRMKWLQKRIRYVARHEHIYTDWNDSVELDGDELSVEVEYPLKSMSRYQQARYRLRVLLVNSQGVLDGEAHEWALQTAKHQCAMYWDKKQAKRGLWNADECPEESRILSLLLSAEIDLEPWSYAYSVDCYVELPETPPLAWVKATGLLQQLFGLTVGDELEENDELHLAAAYALHALRETQPENWHTELYLADVLKADLPTYVACQKRIAERIATIPALSSFAEELRQAGDLEATNVLLKRLYEEVGPALGIWVIA